MLYDGECPFCTGYTRYARLREKHGAVDLIDARERPDLVQGYLNKGFDIDESFIVDVDGEILTHDEAMAYINAQLAPKWTGLHLLASPVLLKTAYPILRLIRNATLKMLGRKKIRDRDQD